MEDGDAMGVCTVDEDLKLPEMEDHFDIDWNEGEFDLMAVKEGKCRVINNMDEFRVFEVTPTADILPEGTWFSARWENQQRGDEVRCRYVAREFKKLDPLRDDLFTPASESSTGRCIDFKIARCGQPAAIADAANAYFHATVEGIAGVAG